MSTTTQFIKIIESTQDLQFVIVGNGKFLVKEIILEITQNKIIVALDGAADTLASLNITPHFIIGDFDSVDMHYNQWGITKSFDNLSDNDKPYLGNHGVTIVPAKDQSQTDLIKAIRYCDSLGAKAIEVICANGGRMDHHEGNMRALRSEYKKARSLKLYTEQQTLSFAKDEDIVLHGEPDDKCGILAFPAGTFSSSGLSYDEKNFKLNFGFAESVCNSLKTKEATVTIQGEALLVMPPMYLSQRQFMAKSLVERLELELRDAKCFEIINISK